MYVLFFKHVNREFKLSNLYEFMKDDTRTRSSKLYDQIMSEYIANYVDRPDSIQVFEEHDLRINFSKRNNQSINIISAHAQSQKTKRQTDYIIDALNNGGAEIAYIFVSNSNVITDQYKSRLGSELAAEGIRLDVIDYNLEEHAYFQFDGKQVVLVQADDVRVNNALVVTERTYNLLREKKKRRVEEGRVFNAVLVVDEADTRDPLDSDDDQVDVSKVDQSIYDFLSCPLIDIESTWWTATPISFHDAGLGLASTLNYQLRYHDLDGSVSKSYIGLKDTVRHTTLQEQTNRDLADNGLNEHNQQAVLNYALQCQSGQNNPLLAPVLHTVIVSEKTKVQDKVAKNMAERFDGCGGRSLVLNRDLSNLDEIKKLKPAYLFWAYNGKSKISLVDALKMIAEECYLHDILNPSMFLLGDKMVNRGATIGINDYDRLYALRDSYFGWYCSSTIILQKRDVNIEKFMQGFQRGCGDRPKFKIHSTLSTEVANNDAIRYEMSKRDYAEAPSGELRIIDNLPRYGKFGTAKKHRRLIREGVIHRTNSRYGKFESISLEDWNFKEMGSPNLMCGGLIKLLDFQYDEIMSHSNKPDLNDIINIVGKDLCISYFDDMQIMQQSLKCHLRDVTTSSVSMGTNGIRIAMSEDVNYDISFKIWEDAEGNKILGWHNTQRKNLLQNQGATHIYALQPTSEGLNPALYFFPNQTAVKHIA